MASVNKTKKSEKVFTHEGGRAVKGNIEQQLRRSVMTTLLWEDNFYEDGLPVADRIKSLTQKVGKEKALQILNESKFDQKLRHAPLWMITAMLEKGWLTKEDIAKIITRADDMTELLSLYWKDGKKPLAHSLRKGLGLAFKKFDEYKLQKYNRKKDIMLKDVLKLVRPIPENEEQSALWKKLIDNNLATPITWETELSAGKDKKTTFEILLSEKKLGDLAFLRNMRNMIESGVSRELIRESFKNRKWGFILPFQFITAARHGIDYEPEIETAMLKSLSNFDKIRGSVSILIDKSGSMDALISNKSELKRYDVACGVAMLLREVCEDISIYTFEDLGGWRESNNQVIKVPARRGFSLREAMGTPKGGTYMWDSIRKVASKGKSNVMIIITDEQTSDSGCFKDANSDYLFIINVSNNERGVGYDNGLIHISGWSENVVKYIVEFLKTENSELVNSCMENIESIDD
jgi:hypothetical protein